MQQQLQPRHLERGWMGSKLPAVLAGDAAAAVISATLISPLITAIDRAVVENASSSKHPLFSALKSHVVCSFRHPRLFFAARPFFYVWTLYAATYTTANSVESISKAFASKSEQVLVSSITFLSTCVVNVPLGVWKDVRYVQLYGQPTAPNKTPKSPIVATATVSGTQRTHARPAGVPRIVGATFLFRDAITIFGSINLPPMLSPFLSDSYFANPAMKMIALQLFVPILSQVVATPVHLLALDLYNNPAKNGIALRMARMKRSFAPTTAMRCSRIIPAFGVGFVVNTGLRDYFHDMAGVSERT